MSEPTYDDDQNVPDSDIKDLRRAAGRAKELEREIEGLRREQAFRKAGLDPDDKRTGYFVKGYGGELDPAAIRAEAEQAGFLPTPGPNPEQQQALAGQQRMDQIVSGAIGSAGSLEAEARLAQVYQQGGTPALLAELAQLGIPIATGD